MEPYKNGYSLLSTKKGYAIVTSQITRIWYILEPFFLRVYSGCFNVIEIFSEMLSKGNLFRDRQL